MTRDETRGKIDLSLPIEGFEQSDTLLFGQNRQEIAERSRDRQAYTPTVAILDPEQRDLPHDIRRRYAGRKLAVDGFGNDKAQDMPEAVVEPLAPMRCRISVTESRPHPDLAVTPLPADVAGAIVRAVEGLVWPLGRRSLVATLRGSLQADNSSGWTSSGF